KLFPYTTLFRSGDEAGNGAVAGFGVPHALAQEKRARSGEIAERAFGQLNQSERRIGDGAEHVGESHGGPRNVGSKLLRVRGHIARRVNVDADALCLSGIELQVAGDKRAMLRGPVALKGVEKAAAFDGVFSRYRRGSRRFAGACNGECCGNVQ